MIKRKEHWDTRHFHHYLRNAASEPFKWGTNDCCLFAANGIEAITGIDIADDFRGKYNDKISAFKLIHEITGGSTVADAAAYCAQKHGLNEYEMPLHVKRGDLATVENDGNMIAGLVHLNGASIVSVSESGLVIIPITKVLRAWAI